jgi:glucose-1-phosphate cytidylyltransferase
MVEIGGHPIVWHIMKIYSHYGFNDFVILTGYKSHIIKDYFINYYTRYCDVTVNMLTNSVEIHKTRQEPWKVTLLYTGQETMTGSRIKKAQEYIGNETFMLTYGDGIANIDIRALLASHKNSGKIATMTTVQISGRFGSVAIKNNTIVSFNEKPLVEESWINGGFFVCENKVFDYISASVDSVIFERDPLENLAKESQLNAYKHNGFWQAMDSLREKNLLNSLWNSTKAPWKVW